MSQQQFPIQGRWVYQNDPQLFDTLRKRTLSHLQAALGRVLGKADDWDGAGGGETHFFPGPGDYLVELSLEGFRTVWVKIVVSPAAKRDVVDVDTELEEID